MSSVGSVEEYWSSLNSLPGLLNWLMGFSSGSYGIGRVGRSRLKLNNGADEIEALDGTFLRETRASPDGSIRGELGLLGLVTTQSMQSH